MIVCANTFYQMEQLITELTFLQTMPDHEHIQVQDERMGIFREPYRLPGNKKIFYFNSKVNFAIF